VEATVCPLGRRSVCLGKFLEAEHLEQFQALAAFVVGGGEHHQSLLVVESDECLAVQEQVARPRVDHGLAVRSFDGHLVLGRMRRKSLLFACSRATNAATSPTPSCRPSPAVATARPATSPTAPPCRSATSSPPCRQPQDADVTAGRSIPRAAAAPIAALMDGSACLLRRRTPPRVTNWLVADMGRDRSYDISAARTDLGCRPRISVDAGLREMAPQKPAPPKPQAVHAHLSEAGRAGRHHGCACPRMRRDLGSARVIASITSALDQGALWWSMIRCIWLGVRISTA
jgi:hypothetical protein